MSFLSVLYTEILWRPLFNGLIWFYNVLPLHDLGVAIILLTIVIRLVLAPLLWKAQKAQKDLQRIQPEIKKIQEKFKSDKEGQSKALMELYATHKVNPFSGCLMILIQFPLLIALLSVFRIGFEQSSLSYLYAFIENPGTINPISFGILNLAQGSVSIGLLAAITQYIQTKMTYISTPTSQGENSFSQMMRIQGLYMFPVIIFITSFQFPSALAVYWTVMNVFGILQELVMWRIAQRKEK
jgi:YidC/Oxa1 family membrane protein insertase